MKKIFAFVAVSGLSLLPVVTIQAQSKDIPAGKETRPRSVNAPPIATPVQTAAPATATSANIDMAVNPDRIALTARQFTPNVIRTRISEAERFFKSRPKQTAM